MRKTLKPKLARYKNFASKSWLQKPAKQANIPFIRSYLQVQNKIAAEMRKQLVKAVDRLLHTLGRVDCI